MGRLDIPPLGRELALLTRFLAAVRRQSLNVICHASDVGQEVCNLFAPHPARNGRARLTSYTELVFCARWERPRVVDGESVGRVVVRALCEAMPAVAPHGAAGIVA